MLHKREVFQPLLRLTASVFQRKEGRSKPLTTSLLEGNYLAFFPSLFCDFPFLSKSNITDPNAVTISPLQGCYDTHTSLRGIYIFIYFFLHVGLIDTAFRFLRNLVTVRSGKQSSKSLSVKAFRVVWLRKGSVFFHVITGKLLFIYTLYITHLS